MNLKKATRSKTIADIRLYKSAVENADGNSLPGEFADRTLNAKLKRIVMKLREGGFSLGEFDHLYINFTTFPIDNEIAAAKRSPDKYHLWYRFYDVRIRDDLFSRLSHPESADEVLELVKTVLVRNFVTDGFDGARISSCFDHAMEQGESMLMKYKETTAGQRTAVIYLKYLDSCQFLPLLRVFDNASTLLFETDLPKMDDLNRLGTVQVTRKKVTVKPRKNAFTETIPPLSFAF